jgi:hypothetical protein
MVSMLCVVCAYVAVTEAAKAWFFRDARRRAALSPQAPGLKPLIPATKQLKAPT